MVIKTFVDRHKGVLLFLLILLEYNFASSLKITIIIIIDCHYSFAPRDAQGLQRDFHGQQSLPQQSGHFLVQPPPNPYNYI